MPADCVSSLHAHKVKGLHGLNLTRRDEPVNPVTDLYADFDPFFARNAGGGGKVFGARGVGHPFALSLIAAMVASSVARARMVAAMLGFTQCTSWYRAAWLVGCGNEA
jgi:hypothetical protein